MMLNTPSKRVVSLLPLVLGAGLLAVGCKDKAPEEKKAEIQADAQKDMAKAEDKEDKKVADIQKDANKDLAKVEKSEAKDDRSALADDSKKQIDGLSDRLDNVEKSVKDRGDAAKTAAAPTLADAKSKLEAAKSELKSLKDADATAWAAMKPKVEGAIQSLESSVKRAEDTLQAH